MKILYGTKLQQTVTTMLPLMDSCHLINGDSQGIIIMWDYNIGVSVQSTQLHSAQINTLALYNLGDNFAAGGADGVISLWEVRFVSQRVLLKN